MMSILETIEKSLFEGYATSDLGGARGFLHSHVKQSKKNSGGDALRGDTRSHPEHEG